MHNEPCFIFFFPLHYSWILSIHLLNSAAVSSLIQYLSDVRYLIRISLCYHKVTLLHEVRLWSPPLDAPEHSPAVLHRFLMFLSSCPTLIQEPNLGETWGAISTPGATSTPEIPFSENLKLLRIISLLSYCLILNFSNVFYQYEILFSFVHSCTFQSFTMQILSSIFPQM